MNTKTFKEELLKSGIFRKVSTAYQYRCQYCPYCGDARYHLYVKIKTDDDSPVVYNCKKCNASGYINQRFLEYYGLEDLKIPRFNGGFHGGKIDNGKISVKEKKYVIDENVNCDDVLEYIGGRLGIVMNMDDLKVCQYMWNPYGYAKSVLGFYGGTRFFEERCWFKLTNGGIIGRYMGNDDSVMRWKQCKTNKLIGGGLYQLSLPVDTGKEINAVITEGIMDGIGMWKHGGVDNGVYISCMGSDYERGIEHLIDLGLFGDTVNVGVYVDGDVDIQKLWFDKYLMMLFKHVDIYRNTLEKDYGVKGDLINIERVRRIV